MKTKLKIGAQLYTVRNECAKDFAGTMKKIREIGYTGVQVSGVKGVSPKEIKKVASDHGLEIMATHVGLDELEKRFDGVMEDHEILGCRHIAMPALPKDKRGAREHWVEAARSLNQIAEKAALRNVVISYHNHAFEFETKFDGKYGLDLIFETAPRVCGEIDTYWVWKGGENPSRYLSRFKNRAPMVHLKDADKVDDSFAEVGHGKLDWKSIFTTLDEIGTIGVLVEQDECKRPPLESLKMSYEFLSAPWN